ncbi:MAG: hypothetical protein ACE37H_02210 [Phycisphaeraceae bacterium]
MLKQRKNTRISSDRRCAGGRADRRGSAIVLVLVSIVLMAILAATLLQVTRFERIPRPASNIDIVVESVIEEIANQLTDDLLDNDGNMFNVNLTVGPSGNGGGDEPWDYPWTNPSSAFGREAELIDGSTRPVYGGAMDDSWLASSAPDFRSAANLPPGGAGDTITRNLADNNAGIWRKISNITGLYLGGTGGSADLSTVEQPTEYLVNNNLSPFNTDANVSTNSTLLVDADGDGVGDSRWEWAPIRQIGTTRYVMAVRVIDLSGRLDVNTAMGRVLPSDASATRGDGPTEVDGNIFMTETAAAGGLNQAAAQNEWRDVLNFRMTGTVPSPPAIIAAETRYDRDQVNPAFPSRRHYWEQGASRLSPTFVRSTDVGRPQYGPDATFKIVDALELLHRNGLNSASRSTLEQLMPNTLRDRDGVEDPFSASRTRVTAYNWNRRQFFENDIRKQVSPFTGAMAAVRPPKFAEKRAPKLDINVAAKTALGRDQIRQRITRLLTSNFASAGQFTGRYPHITSPFDFADQFTANVADYIDRDNRITTVNNEAGFEALPYITEVYTQRLYEVTNVQPNPAPATSDRVTWDAQGGQGYVIEIGNPFARFQGGRWVGRAVSLEGVWLKLYDGAPPVELSSLNGAPNELEPGEVLHVFRSSAGNTNAGEDDLDGYHPEIASGNFTTVHTAQGPVYPAGRRNARISLHAELQDAAGTAASWAYAACEVQAPANTIQEDLPGATFGPGDQGYAITGYRGIGQGLPMMTVTAAPRSTNARGYTDNIDSLTSPSDNCSAGAPGTRGANRNGYTPELGKEDKADAPTIFGTIDDQQLVWHDNPRERLAWVGDLLQMPLIGPEYRNTNNNGSLMAEAFFRAAGNTADLTDGVDALLLPYKKRQDNTIPVLNNANLFPPLPGSTFGVYNVPHAILLMEQFTTFNPAYDGEDGDDQRIGFESLLSPDQNELLVPGKINLNTASYATLVRALPYPDLQTRQAFANAILERRESLRQLTNYRVGADSVPGIAYTGSLYEQIEELAPGAYGVAGFPGNPSRDGADTDTLNSARIDWNNYEDTPGVFPAGLKDGVIDDREEEIMLSKWLSEVGETRSDVFAAYIVVQGYPAENFKAGVIESARLIVLFSRAGVQDEDDRAVEIGRFRFK